MNDRTERHSVAPYDGLAGVAPYDGLAGEGQECMRKEGSE